MQKRKQVVLFLLLICTSTFFYMRTRHEKIPLTLTVLAEVPPAITENIWLRLAYEAAHEIEDELLRDELLSRLASVSLNVGDSKFAFAVQEQIQNKARKISALAELAISYLRSGDASEYRLHMESAFRIADALYNDQEDMGHAHMPIATTLLRNGYVDDAVAVASSISIKDPFSDTWVEWFRESAVLLANRGDAADARFVAAVNPRSWSGEQTRSYIDIASIQNCYGDDLEAKKTIQAAAERAREQIDGCGRAYSYALIASVSARMGFTDMAITMLDVCHSYLQWDNLEKQKELKSCTFTAKTLAELSRTYFYLDKPEDAKQWLGLAEISAKDLGDTKTAAMAWRDIVDVLMSVGKFDAAFALAGEMRNTVWHSLVLSRIIEHEFFPRDSTIANRVMEDIADESGRSDLALAYVRSLLRQGEYLEAERVALTIGYRIYKDWAFSSIVEYLLEQGSIEAAIRMASERVQEPWEGVELFIVIGKALATTASGADLHTFLSKQTVHARRAAVCIGIAETLGYNRPNNIIDSDEE